MNVGNQGGKKQNQPPPQPGALVVPGFVPIVNRKCRVCNCVHRQEIDMLLATGWSQKAVRDHFNQILPEGDQLSKDSMSRHTKGHLSARDKAVRNIIEAKAIQMGLDIDTIEGVITTKQAVLETLVHHGMESIAAGTTTVEARDIIQAIQLGDKMESEYREVALDEVMDEFRIFMEAMKEEVPEDMATRVFERFERKLQLRNGANLQPLVQIPARVGEIEVTPLKEEEEVV